jgi:hypothetical protein
MLLLWVYSNRNFHQLDMVSLPFQCTFALVGFAAHSFMDMRFSINEACGMPRIDLSI